MKDRHKVEATKEAYYTYPSDGSISIVAGLPSLFTQPRLVMKLLSILTYPLVVILLTSAVQKESIESAEPYYYVAPELKPYLAAYLQECKKFNTPYVIPKSFSLELTDSLGVANNSGSGVTLFYSEEKIHVLITDEMFSWTEESKRYVIFHELGHALRDLEHQDRTKGIMNTELYPTLDVYHESKLWAAYFENGHFVHGR